MQVHALVAAATLLAGALQIFPAQADDIKIGDLVISQAWSRATPGGAKVASGYLTIENKGSAPDTLLGGKTDVAGKLGVHEMSSINGVMTMRALDGGLTLPAGQTVKLAPGGYHLMLTDLKQPLKQGDSVPMTLTFQKAGNVAVTFSVLGVGAQGPGKPATEGAGGGKMEMDHSKMKM
jgi:copper(I)-binding protein